jgi:hypothetical protein
MAHSERTPAGSQAARAGVVAPNAAPEASPAPAPNRPARSRDQQAALTLRPFATEYGTSMLGFGPDECVMVPLTAPVCQPVPCSPLTLTR